MKICEDVPGLDPLQAILGAELSPGPRGPLKSSLRFRLTILDLGYTLIIMTTCTTNDDDYYYPLLLLLLLLQLLLLLLLLLLLPPPPPKGPTSLLSRWRRRLAAIDAFQASTVWNLCLAA